MLFPCLMVDFQVPVVEFRRSQHHDPCNGQKETVGATTKTGSNFLGKKGTKRCLFCAMFLFGADTG